MSIIVGTTVYRTPPVIAVSSPVPSATGKVREIVCIASCTCSFVAAEYWLA